MTAEKDNYFYLCWKGKSEIAKQVDIALWKEIKQSAKTTSLERDYYFGFSKKLHKDKYQGADKVKIKAVNFGKDWISFWVFATSCGTAIVLRTLIIYVHQVASSH